MMWPWHIEPEPIAESVISVLGTRVVIQWFSPNTAGART